MPSSKSSVILFLPSKSVRENLDNQFAADVIKKSVNIDAQGKEVFRRQRRILLQKILGSNLFHTDKGRKGRKKKVMKPRKRPVVTKTLSPDMEETKMRRKSAKHYNPKHISKNKVTKRKDLSRFTPEKTVKKKLRKSTRKFKDHEDEDEDEDSYDD